MGAHGQAQQHQGPVLPEARPLPAAGLTAHLPCPGPHLRSGPKAPLADPLVSASRGER